MPKVSSIQTSFNTGEISPQLYGRVDLPAYKSAVSVCLNCLPIVEGPVTRRPGTQYVAKVKDSTKETRLVPFKFSTTQAYIIEFGNQYIRFYKNNGQILDGGSPVEVTTPYLTADLFQLKVTQSADVLYIVHPGYAPRKLLRSSDTSWELRQIVFLDGPYSDINIGTQHALTPNATTGLGITISTSSFANISGAADNGSGLIRITANKAHGLITGQIVDIINVGGTTEANGTWTVTKITSTTFDLQGSAFVNPYTIGGLTQPHTFKSTDVGRLIRMLHSSTWGHAKIINVVNAFNVIADVIVDFDAAAPTINWRFGLWSDTTGYPAVVTFYENRLVFGGNTSAQQRLDGSRTGDYENMAPTDIDGTVTNSHAYSFTLNSSDVQVLRWMKNDEKALLVGTAEGEWPVRSSTQGEALSPTNVSAKQSTPFGSSDINAIKVGKAVIYVQKSGKKLRRMSYEFESEGFTAPNLTRSAEHITRGTTVAGSGIKELAWQQDPQPYVWAVRNDGVLLALLYDQDEQVTGWSRHILGGFSNAAKTANPIVESVAVIPASDGSRDEVWMIVQRYINGATVRYIEYMTKIWERGDAREDAVYGDSSLTYDGVATNSITGLTHLKGETVSILVDGKPHPDKVVDSSGKIILDVNGSVVQVGYKYNSDGQMLRQDVGAADGTSQGKTQRAHKVIFRFHDTGPVKVGVNFNTTGPGKLTAIPFKVPLFSGDKVLQWEGDYDRETYFAWRWDSMLPGMLLAVMPVLHTQDA